jgi:hypothetical protein
MVKYEVGDIKAAMDLHFEAQQHLQKIGYEMQQGWMMTGTPPTDEQQAALTKAVRAVQDTSAALNAALLKAGWPRGQ